jgi:hypothetical protein
MRISASVCPTADHVARQVDDLHRLAHVQHEDLTALRPWPPACSTSCAASGMVMK